MRHMQKEHISLMKINNITIVFHTCILLLGSVGKGKGEQRSKLGFYVPFNSQGHIGTGPENCHLWDSNSQR